ncbi:hypothetical protein ACIRRA_41720 [Nocardia sp. NPDC101769]|uniref:hypothetical protein n=1 Tax=Nocardia sp. NPDC101769 TaxID=3364333 RepID=UPI0038298AF5
MHQHKQLSATLAEAFIAQALPPIAQDTPGLKSPTRHPVESVVLVAAIACRVLDAERSEMHLLRGAAAVSPELAAIGQKEQMRFEQQAPVIDVLVDSGRLENGLDVPTARDILWTLSGRETYRMLVIERGWSSERYEAWLSELLVAALLRDRVRAWESPFTARCR